MFYLQAHNKSPDGMLLSSGLPFVQVGHASRKSEELPITTHSPFIPLIPLCTVQTSNCFLQKMLASMKSLSCNACQEVMHQF